MWVAEENGRDRNEPGGAGRRDGLLSAILGASARLLEAEHDRWILWVPVLFAAGILSYFVLADEPAVRLALALVVGALGLSLAFRHARLGLCIGGAALAFASGSSAATLWAASAWSRGNGRAHPPSRSARGGLPSCRHRHRPLHHRQEMPGRARYRRSPHAEGARRAFALYRRPLDQDRDGHGGTRVEALGARSRHRRQTTKWITGTGPYRRQPRMNASSGG